jgi:acyl carrier protein
MAASLSTTGDRRIVTIVEQFLPMQSIGRPIDADERLDEAGLTSLGMVDLMLAIEAEFDLTIPGSLLIPDNFRSISAIDALVSRLLQGVKQN